MLKSPAPKANESLAKAKFNTEIAKAKNAPALDVKVPGRSTGYPVLPPTDPYVKISLIRFLGSDSFTESSTRQATPRLAYNFAALRFSDIIYCVLFLVLETGNLFGDHQIILFLCGFFGLTIDATLFPHIRIQLQVL